MLSNTMPLAAHNPSGEAMPTGDLTGWHLIFKDDFTTNAAEGQFLTNPAYSSRWDNYDGFGDTSLNGYYTDSILSAENSMLKLHVHTGQINGTGAVRHKIAAPGPI